MRPSARARAATFATARSSSRDSSPAPRMMVTWSWSRVSNMSPPIPPALARLEEVHDLVRGDLRPHLLLPRRLVVEVDRPAHPDPDDLLRERRPLAERRRHEHPAVRIEVHLVGGRVEAQDVAL